MDAINGEHFVVTVLLILRISLYKKNKKSIEQLKLRLNLTVLRTVVGFHGSFLFRPISAKIENSTSNILDFIFIFQIWNQMICEKKKTKKKKKAQIQVEQSKNLFLIAGSLYVVGHLNIPSSFFFFVSPSPPHFSIVLL